MLSTPNIGTQLLLLSFKSDIVYCNELNGAYFEIVYIFYYKKGKLTK